MRSSTFSIVLAVTLSSSPVTAAAESGSGATRHGTPMKQGVEVPSSGQKQVVFTIPEPSEQ